MKSALQYYELPSRLLGTDSRRHVSAVRYHSHQVSQYLQVGLTPEALNTIYSATCQLKPTFGGPIDAASLPLSHSSRMHYCCLCHQSLSLDTTSRRTASKARATSFTSSALLVSRVEARSYTLFRARCGRFSTKAGNRTLFRPHCGRFSATPLEVDTDLQYGLTDSSESQGRYGVECSQG